VLKQQQQQQQQQQKTPEQNPSLNCTFPNYNSLESADIRIHKGSLQES
jgi:hypothetical protein